MPQYYVPDHRLWINLPFRVASLERGECSEAEISLRWTFMGFPYRHKEPDTIAWLKSIPDGEMLLDVGANVGVYTLHYLQTHPTGAVIAVEPDPVNMVALRENLAVNGYEARAVVLAGAIMCDAPAAYLPCERIEAGRSAAVVAARPPGGHIEVHILTDEELSFRRGPKYVKIDVDGGEDAVVKKIFTLGWSHDIIAMMIEVNSPETHEIVLSCGFREDGRLSGLRRRGSQNRLYMR